MTLRAIALVSIALSTSCTTAAPEPDPEPKPKAQARCFFEGDVTNNVRITKVDADDAVAFDVEWDAAAPAGATWTPPIKAHGVSMPFGVNCRDPFDVLADTGVEATLMGDRAIRVRMPRAMIDGIAGRCASRKLELPLTLRPGDYAADCRALDGDGLPFHNLAVLLTVGADGTLTFESVVGSSYLEG